MKKENYADDIMSRIRQEEKQEHIFPENFGRMDREDESEDTKIPDPTDDKKRVKDSLKKGVLPHGMLTQMMKIEHLSYDGLDDATGILRYFGFSEEDVEQHGARKIEEFIRNERTYFLERYKLFLNILLPPADYAEFRGVDYLTVLGWIKDQKVDVLKFAKRKYIIPSYDEILALDKWMMLKKLKKDSLFGSGMIGREENLALYERRYSSGEAEMEVLRLPVDDVKQWCIAIRISPYGIGRRGAKSSRTEKERMDFRLDEKHEEYLAWAKENRKAELTRKSFTIRIKDLGFTANTRLKKRGFYCYEPFTDSLKEIYGRDEWTVPTEGEINNQK